jgi:hypothetical protein
MRLPPPPPPLPPSTLLLPPPPRRLAQQPRRRPAAASGASNPPAAAAAAPAAPAPAAASPGQSRHLARPRADAAAAAEDHHDDSTRRRFHQIFEEGIWPATMEKHRVNEGRYPETFRHLPEPISKDELRKMTVNGESVADDLQTALSGQGVALVLAEVLRGIAGNMLDDASSEAQEYFRTTGNSWDVVFHDAAKFGEGILVGDRTKRMSPSLNPDSATVRLVQKVLPVLMPGFEIATNSDGSLHFVLLHDGGGQPYPGCHYCQATHSDVICRYVGRGFEAVNPTLQACLRRDGLRVVWLNLELLRAISLGFFRGSHHLSCAANLFYQQHYTSLWMEFQRQRTPATVTEDDFYLVWAALLQQHLEEEVMQSDVGRHIEKAAVAVPVPPLAVGIWNGLTGHSGLSHDGLRGFCVVWKLEDRGKAQVPYKDIDAWGTSPVYAGIIGGLLEPLQVCVSYPVVAKAISSEGVVCRSASTSWTTAVISLLRRVDEEMGLRPSPHGADNKPCIIRFEPRHGAKVFGIVCEDRNRCKAVLWVENRAGKDASRDDKSCNYRGAAFTNQMSMRLKRGDAERLRPVAGLFPSHPEIHVATFGDAARLVYFAITLQGVPLPEWLKSVLEPWVHTREIPEELRLGMNGVTRGFEGLEDRGWRFVVVDPATLSIDIATCHVKLIYAGGGFLGEPMRPRCNQGGHRAGLQPMMRRSSSYRDVDASGHRIYRRNLRQMSQTDRDQLKAAEIGEPEPSGGDSSEPSTHVAYNLTDARQWWERQKGQEMGILACWDVKLAELLYDDELAETLKTMDGPSLMTVLRQSDFQQLILWFAFGLRITNRTAREETFSEKKKCLRQMLGAAESVEDACEAMERFLHGLKPRALRNEADKWCGQPAAMRRACEMLVLALDPPSYEKVAEEFSYTLFLTTAIFNPGQELLLQAQGIAMVLKLNPFGDPVFEAEALEVLKSTADGVRRSSRQVLLRNEEEYGVGVFAPGKWKKGDFFGWYLGEVVAIPHGRHVLTSVRSDKARYCDGSISHKLPLSLYIELGAPGAFVNSSRYRPGVRPNLKIDRSIQILHVFRGRLMVASPLFVAYDFADAFTCWDYDPDAAHGSTN